MSVVLYSSGCPMCKVLETKLNQKNIKFEISDNLDYLVEQGVQTLPQLGINNSLIDFKNSCNLVNQYDGNTDFESFVASKKSE